VGKFGIIRKASCLIEITIEYWLKINIYLQGDNLQVVIFTQWQPTGEKGNFLTLSVKFLQDVMYRKLLKLVYFHGVIEK